MASNDKSTRPYHVVVWGATGYTGRLVAEYLFANKESSRLRLALAGRSRQKLEAIRDELAANAPDAEHIAILIGDSLDQASLNTIAAQTAVVCSTVGPYSLYGEGMVKACVAFGTDYCDLSGEVPFIRRMIDAYHEPARRNGSRIVHACGFDSIPSDLATLMVQDEAIRTGGAPAPSVRFYLGESRGGFSGGTIASMLYVLEEARRDRSIRRLLSDPYALNPEGERTGQDGPDQRAVRFDDALGAWTGPFVMAPINTRIVRRTNAVLGYPYGRDFRYEEVASYPPGSGGWLRAIGLSGGLAALLASVRFGPTRELLRRTVLPAPGHGPSADQRERGYFVARILAFADPEEESVALRGRVEGRQDPGYGETAKMIGEAATCLALDDLDADGGVLTPASAMGMRLVERLRTAGMTFDVRPKG